MNKILILLVAISCSIGMSAQNKKDLKKAITSFQKQKTELEAKYQTLISSNARIGKRKFVTENPEESLKKRLAFYRNIKEMAKSNIFEKKPEYEKLPFANSYITLISMYKSLDEDGGYNQKENEAFISELDTIKEHIMSKDIKHTDTFIQSFDDLDNCIRNYRFAMFELARIFVLVKEKEKEEKIEIANIYQSLQDDYETDFVDNIPYTKKLLRRYIISNGKDRSDILKTLKDSCAEAFQNIEKKL